MFSFIGISYETQGAHRRLKPAVRLSCPDLLRRPCTASPQPPAGKGPAAAGSWCSWSQSGSHRAFSDGSPPHRRCAGHAPDSVSGRSFQPPKGTSKHRSRWWFSCRSRSKPPFQFMYSFRYTRYNSRSRLRTRLGSIPSERAVSAME